MKINQTSCEAECYNTDCFFYHEYKASGRQGKMSFGLRAIRSRFGNESDR